MRRAHVQVGDGDRRGEQQGVRWWSPGRQHAGERAWPWVMGRHGVRVHGWSGPRGGLRTGFVEPMGRPALPPSTSIAGVP